MAYRIVCSLAQTGFPKTIMQTQFKIMYTTSEVSPRGGTRPTSPCRPGPPTRRRGFMTLCIVRALALLLATAEHQAFAAENAKISGVIDGIWRWTFTMPDGTTSRPKLTLMTEDGKLTGTSSFRPGSETPITNVVLNGAQLRFQVIRERDGQPIVTTYSGNWSGKSLKGKIESNWAGEKQTYDWEAERAYEGAEGIWKWTASFRGRKYEARVKLEQDGEILTGTIPGSQRAGRPIKIKNGSVENGEVYFEIERSSAEGKSVTIYRGKQTGDTIKGTIEATIDGKEQKSNWEAKRTD